MTAYERRQTLMDTLLKQPGLRIPELALLLDVSEGTVRNDLDVLEQQGLLTRVHGGAVLHQGERYQSASFIKRFQQDVVAKLAIAKEAAVVVSDGDSVFLDASSSVYYFAQAISGRQHLRVITNGFEVALELAKNATNTVVLIGGVVNNGSSSVTGMLSEHTMEELHVQKAFLSCSGFDLESGMTEVHMAEGQLKRKVIEASREVFGLVDSSKFGNRDLTTFARPENITHLFTDQNLSEDWIERLKQAGIKFTICKTQVDRLGDDFISKMGLRNKA